MKRRTFMLLTGMTLFGFAIAALPQIGFAQSNPLIGTSWKLNLEKSKYISGPAPRSATLNITLDGQNVKDTVQIIDAQGNAITGVVMHVYDGLPYPTTAGQDYDATIITRVDANMLIFSRLKAGKLVATGTFVVSPDERTLTITNTGIDRNGQPLNSIAVLDKQ
jgi:hypothetical protein